MNIIMSCWCEIYNASARAESSNKSDKKVSSHEELLLEIINYQNYFN